MSSSSSTSSSDKAPPRTPPPPDRADEAMDESKAPKAEESQEPASHSIPPGDDGVHSNYEAALWDNILDDSHIKLEGFNEQQFYSGLPSPLPGFSAQSPRTPTTPSTASASWPLPSANVQSPYEDLQPSGLIGTAGLPPLLNQPPYSGYMGPNYFVSLDQQPDGTPFPLSKPIVREDGILLVGTEIPVDATTTTTVKNRIFVTNFLRSSEAHSSSHILVDDEVRDMHWMNTQTAIVAVGKEIQLIQLGDPSTNGPCRLEEPINSVHSDTIRELAVSRNMSSYVLSGGFDQTVVLSDLRLQGGQNSTVVGKFDAHDVVSSVRWSPNEAHLSWTTDGGDFQVADFRAQAAQLQVSLSTFLRLDSMGGLFTHQYMSDFIVALGFEQGQIAFVDTRMPRQTACYATLQSPLAAVGEIRRRGNKCAVFGIGGLATAELNATANGLQNLTLRQQPSQPQTQSAPYKTSGDFSLETGVHLAVSDSLSVVSVYTDDAAFVTSVAFGGTPNSEDWNLTM